MNARHIASILTVIGVIGLTFALTISTYGQSGIIVNGADTVRNTAVSSLQGLIDSISGVQPHIVVQYANGVRPFSLSAVPSALETLVGQLAPRVVFQYANANRRQLLVYPVALIGDTAPPQGSNITAKPAGETSATVTWVTDEYADSTVRCGTQPGNYTMTFSDPLYVKPHSITLTGLTAGVTYYCVCSSADPSGNTYQSQEFSFEQVEEVFIYLPLVLRNK